MKHKFLLKTMLLLFALIAGSSSVWATGTLVSSLSGISSGETYYIAAFSSDKYYTVPNTTIDGQTFTCVEGSYNSTAKTLTTPTGAGEFVFTAVPNVDNAFYIYNTNLDKYLVATASKKFGYVDNTSDDYGYWTFSTVTSGGFSGVFSVQHSSKTHYMRATSNTVKCYDGASNQGVYLFVKTIVAVEAPTISPTAGTYYESVAKEITIESPTSGSTLYCTYTTDGSEPSDPKNAIASANTTVTVNAPLGATTKIRAIAKKGEDWSVETTATYVINDLTAAKTLPYEETFESGKGYFTIEAITTPNGLESIWKADNSHYMKATSYSNGNKAGEARLISPKIDLTSETGKTITLSFDQCVNKFFGTTTNEAMLEVRTWDTNAWSNWTKVDITYPDVGTASYSSFETQNVNLSTYAGKIIQFAFHYIGTTSASGTWEIKNVNVVEGVIQQAAELSFPKNYYVVFLGNDFNAPQLTKNGTDGDLSYESSNTAVATVNQTTGAVTIVGEGETTITAKTAETTAYTAGEASYSLIVVDATFYESFNASTGTTGWSGNGVASGALTADNAGWTFENGNGNGGSAKFGTSAKKGKATTPTIALDNTKVYELTFKAGAWTNDETTLTLSAEGASIQKKTVTIGNATWVNCSVKIFNASANTKITFESVQDSKARFFLDDVKIKECNGDDLVPIEIGASKYASFSSAENVDFTGTGLTAYTAKVEGSVVKLTAIDNGIVPANTGVILGADVDGSYAGLVTTTGGSVSENELLISNGSITGGDGIYALASKGEPAVVGFYKVKNTVTIPAGKCYLNTNTSAPEYLAFSFGGETTGISATLNDKGQMTNDKVVYNLNGQRVAQPTKGLYIVNGKKVMFK